MDGCFEIRKEYKGKGKKIKNVETPADCQTECQKDDSCQFFTWHQKHNACVLKAAKGNIINTVKWMVSGPKNCPGGKGLLK